MAALSSALRFDEMNLDPRIIKAIRKLGWSQPTPIQALLAQGLLQSVPSLQALLAQGLLQSVPSLQALLAQSLLQSVPFLQASALALSTGSPSVCSFSSGECGNTILQYCYGFNRRRLSLLAQGLLQSVPSLQEKAVPLIMDGKDLIVKAKTGSGKTASYALPMIQKILELRSVDTTSVPSVKALVIVPSQELSIQAASQIKELCNHCSKDIKVFCVSQTSSVSSQRITLLEFPDVIVGTPRRILSHLSGKSLLLTESLQLVIFDEADLLFTYGYEQDINDITSYLPSPIQSILMSATLNEDVISLKKVILHQPVTLKLEVSELPEEDRLTQYHIQCVEDDKFLLIYTLLKLKLIKGKTLIFVNDITRCYKLKLFLEQFSIKSCVLNSELPHNSRYHVIEQFNRNIYDYIIATDELIDHTHPSKRKRKRQDKEYGVSRGIDFQGVSNVVNFDFPATPKAYVHRVGRTARGYDYGTALTFVSPNEETKLTELQSLLKQERDTDQDLVKPYKFRISEIEGFRYRVQDAVHSVTQLAIKEARLKEIRCELLSSSKLKTHFEENPRDLQVLRHDRGLLPSNQIKEHLKYIPPYLVPKLLRKTITDSGGGGGGNLKRKRARKEFRPHNNNPLKTLKVSDKSKLDPKPSKKRKTEHC